MRARRKGIRIRGFFPTLPLAAAGLLLAATLGCPSALAKGRECSAGSVKKLKRLNRDALDELDRWNLTKARRKLDDAKLVASTRGCERHPELAETYAIRGVVALRGRKKAAMKKAWTKALRLDWNVQIPKRAASPKVLRWFRWIKKNTKPPTRKVPRRRAASGKEGGGADPRRAAPPPRRRRLPPPKGFEHQNPRKWRKGKDLYLIVRAPKAFGMETAKLYYRPKGEKGYKVKEFVKGGPDRWSWRVKIPGVYLYIPELQYFIVAYGAKNRPLSASGNSMKPNVIRLIPAK
jgi:hypothetical protein